MYDKLKNIIAMVIFGSIGFFVRFIPLQSSVIALSRASIGGVFLLLLMLVIGEKISFSALKKNWLVLLLSGIAVRPISTHLRISEMINAADCIAATNAAA